MRDVGTGMCPRSVWPRAAARRGLGGGFVFGALRGVGCICGGLGGADVGGTLAAATSVGAR